MLKRKTLALMLAIPMALSVSCKKKETEPSKDTSKRTTQTEETTKETEAPTETTPNQDDAKPIDPFEGLSVSIKGIEGFPEVSFDTSACDDLVKNNVVFDYETDNDFLCANENIKVIAKFTDASDEEASVKKINGTKYKLAQTSKTVRVTKEDLWYLIRTEAEKDATEFLKTYIIDTWIPTAKQEILDRMMTPAQTKDGLLQVSSCGSVIDIQATNTTLCVYPKSEERSEDPVTDIFLLMKMSCSASGTFSETQQEVQNYDLERYAILHVEFPGYANDTEAPIKNIEVLYTDDIDEFIKSIQEEYEQSNTEDAYFVRENKIHDYIKTNFSDKIHSPDMIMGVDHRQIVHYGDHRREFDLDFETKINV